jgi:hypothetical protein
MTALLLGGCGATSRVVFAQAAPAKAEAAKPAAAPVPQFSTAEKIAIGALAEKLQTNQKERDGLSGALRQLEAEFAAAHPGFHFDEATGTIVADPTNPTNTTKPAAAPAAKPGAAKP